MENKTLITENAEQTRKIGEKIVSRSEILLRKTKGATVIALYGDLGSGKTTFVQGLAKGLGVEQRIISPTFIIIRKYAIKFKIHPDLIGTKFKNRIKNFYHIDLYRINKEDDIKGLEIEEILKNPNNVLAIEWPEKIENLLPKERINISFEYLDENKRKIIIDYGRN